MTGHNYPDDLYADALTGQCSNVDTVNKPPHYTFGKVECIDAIESALSPEEFRGFLKGQVIKYVWRNGRKGDPREDAAKGEWYQRRLNQLLGGKPAAAMREAKIAYDVACDKTSVCVNGCPPLTVCDYCQGRGGPDRQPERVPKWDPRWSAAQGVAGQTVSDGLAWNGPSPPNCDGLSARDVRAPHPMASEALKQADEFGRDHDASGV